MCIIIAMPYAVRCYVVGDAPGCAVSLSPTTPASATHVGAGVIAFVFGMHGDTAQGDSEAAVDVPAERENPV